MRLIMYQLGYHATSKHKAQQRIMGMSQHLAGISLQSTLCSCSSVTIVTIPSCSFNDSDSNHSNDVLANKLLSFLTEEPPLPVSLKTFSSKLQLWSIMRLKHTEKSSTSSSGWCGVWREDVLLPVFCSFPWPRSSPDDVPDTSPAVQWPAWSDPALHAPWSTTLNYTHLHVKCQNFIILFPDI